MLFTASHISSYVAGFLNYMLNQLLMQSTVGTLNAIPVNFPFNDGITFPTAFAAPVDDGIIFADAALPPSPIFF